eukprot:1449980-Pleurochrysis_carterae.AAC.1
MALPRARGVRMLALEPCRWPRFGHPEGRQKIPASGSSACLLAQLQVFSSPMLCACNVKSLSAAE